MARPTTRPVCTARACRTLHRSIGEYRTLPEVRDAITKLTGAALNGCVVKLAPLVRGGVLRGGVPAPRAAVACAARARVRRSHARTLLAARRKHTTHALTAAQPPPPHTHTPPPPHTP
jgi:hypothetical protein